MSPTFFEASVENAPVLIAVVLGLVTLYGKFGLKGNVQLASSLATGIVLGSLFQIAALGLPVDFKGWFGVAVYGLVVGLIASGVYEVGKYIAAKNSGA